MRSWLITRIGDIINSNDLTGPCTCTCPCDGSWYKLLQLSGCHSVYTKNQAKSEVRTDRWTRQRECAINLMKLLPLSFKDAWSLLKRMVHQLGFQHCLFTVMGLLSTSWPLGMLSPLGTTGWFQIHLLCAAVVTHLVLIILYLVQLEDSPQLDVMN